MDVALQQSGEVRDEFELQFARQLARIDLIEAAVPNGAAHTPRSLPGVARAGGRPARRGRHFAG
jgi:hypothetical protein